LILILNIEIGKHEYKSLGLKPKGNVETYAAKLSEYNKYLGYLGWAEVYLT